MPRVQIEITKSTRLLDETGNLESPGFCRQNLYIYNKENIKKNRWRIKEWDYYMISDGRYVTELNFYNISALASLSANILDLKTGEQFSDSVLEFSTPDKFKMSPSADALFEFRYDRGGRSCKFITTPDSKRLIFSGRCKGKPFEADITAKRRAGDESLTAAIPFKKKGRFFLTQKLNCMNASGTVKVCGREIKYDPDKTYLTMDWGRGLWPHRSMWYWSNGSGEVNKKPFGFELTWGFGDVRYAAETAVFYDGRCNKIGAVQLKEDPQTDGFMKPWHFISDDGRLDLILTPKRRRKTGFILLDTIGMKSNQAFGDFNGSVVLDSGERLEIKNLHAFAEKVVNRW